MTVTVTRCTTNALIQTLSNSQYQHWGYSEGGAMDEYAFMWANRLLNNAIDSAALEITLGQLQLYFERDCYIAITGADCAAYKSSASQSGTQTVGNWQVSAMSAGETLTLKMPKQGLRTYIAFASGIRRVITASISAQSTSTSSAKVNRDNTGNKDTRATDIDDLPSPMIENSLASHVINRQPLVPNCKLIINQPSQTVVKRCVNRQYISNYQQVTDHDQTIDYVPSTLAKQQGKDFGLTFGQQVYVIDSASNRMGYRLRGQALTINHQQRLSTPTSLGAIQLPADGQPIVLLKDRQTIGGYPVLGCVTRQSTWQLAQMRPGQAVRFQAVTAAHACEQLNQLYQFFFS
ncbi:hypothetical protein QWY77_13505 [Thalassotalea ponticola]|uniref:5-oxoprolinase subunit C family protein n=1 Tax=Thalassotalea ponticola TaxID=1523392 RepID=UPI0025B4A109|nr:hypothetical protein [Thalassotalea ponticola]MDN3653756.1 hypothetical protein [Thalassotalea ponticola]